MAERSLYNHTYEHSPIPKNIEMLFQKSKDDPVVGMGIFDNPNDPHPRRTIGHKIASGGFSCVYYCRDNKLDRLDAIKIARIHPTSPISGHIIQPSETEIQAELSIHNPYLVSVYDYKILDHGHFAGSPRVATVFELLSPEQYSPVSHLILPGKLKNHQIADIVSQSADGLDIMHGHKPTDSEFEQIALNPYLHLDFKPSNVFYSKNKRQVKISDLGMAAARSIVEEIPGALVGTLYYMSPEYLSGCQPTHYNDLWAHAVTSFEMITGRKPFNLDGCSGKVEVAQGIIDANALDIPDTLLLCDSLESIGVRNVDDQDMVKDQFNQAFYRDQDNRFKTAGEFAVPIAEVLNKASV